MSRAASELSLRGRSDEEQLAAATRNDRILVTHDDDFLNDRCFPPSGNPGLVAIAGSGESTEELTAALEILFTLIAPYRELWREAKIISSGGYNRPRPKPRQWSI
jgi:predicted nuclease of predicted toxin-antitoxin system